MLRGVLMTITKIPHPIFIFICVSIFYGIEGGKKQSSSTIVIHNSGEDGEDDHSDLTRVVALPFPVPHQIHRPNLAIHHRLMAQASMNSLMAIKNYQSAPIISTSIPAHHSPSKVAPALALPPLPSPPRPPPSSPPPPYPIRHLHQVQQEDYRQLIVPPGPAIITQIPALPHRNTLADFDDRISRENDLSFIPYQYPPHSNGDTNFYNLYEPWPPAYTDAKNQESTNSDEQINMAPNEVKNIDLGITNDAPYLPDYYPDSPNQSGDNDNMIYDNLNDNQGKGGGGGGGGGGEREQDDYPRNNNEYNNQEGRDFNDKFFIPPPEFSQEYQNNDIKSNQYEPPNGEITSSSLPPEVPSPDHENVNRPPETVAPLTTEENRFEFSDDTTNNNNQNYYKSNEYAPDYYSNQANSAEYITTYQPTSLSPTTSGDASREQVNNQEGPQTYQTEPYYDNREVDYYPEGGSKVINGHNLDWQMYPTSIDKPVNELTGDPYLDDFPYFRPLNRFPEYGSSYNREPPKLDQFEDRKSSTIDRDDYAVSDEDLIDTKNYRRKRFYSS